MKFLAFPLKPGERLCHLPAPRKIRSKIFHHRFAISFSIFKVSLRAVHHNYQHVCAGTILAPRWILTAAHCFTFLKTPEDILIQHGTNELNPSNRKFKKIKEILQHPGYNPTVVIHDVGLVELQTPLALDWLNQKVQLWENSTMSYENVNVTLLGWGLNETSGSLSPKLQKISLDLISPQACRSQLQSVIHKTNLCAGGSGRGQCSGDSGGPLLFDNKQIGLVSWSLKPCGSKPGVFTNISYYLDWIRYHVEK